MFASASDNRIDRGNNRFYFLSPPFDSLDDTHLKRFFSFNEITTIFMQNRKHVSSHFFFWFLYSVFLVALGGIEDWLCALAIHRMSAQTIGRM